MAIVVVVVVVVGKLVYLHVPPIMRERAFSKHALLTPLIDSSSLAVHPNSRESCSAMLIFPECVSIPIQTRRTASARTRITRTGIGLERGASLG